MRLKFSRRCKGSLFSRQLTIGLIILIILADLMDLSPHGILAQRRPRPCHRHHHYHHRCPQQQQRQRGYHHRHHHYHRRRNDTSSAEIIQATVVSIDEFSGSSGSSSVGSNSSVFAADGDSGFADLSISSGNGGNSTVEEGTAETIGIIRGFLPGLNLGGGGNKGKGGGGGGFFRNAFGGGGKGRGLFGGGGHGNDDNNNSGGKVIFPESPPPPPPHPTPSTGGTDEGQGGYSSGPGGYGTSGQSSSTGGMMMGWGSEDGQKGKEASGGKGGLFGGGGLFRNPFGGGGGGGGKGRGPFRLLSKLNSDQPCAAGIGSLPILSRIPFLPKTRFPSFIPSGVNTCDATCGGSGGGEWRRVPPTDKEKEEMEKNGGNTCTYNWRDSLTGFPFLLFRCQCKMKCPPKKVRLSGGLLNARCENVSEKKSRCKCPYGQQSFKCTLSFLPVAVPLVQRTKPYYCTCCNDESTPLGEPLGGYGYGPPPPPQVSSTEATAQSQQVVGGYEGAASSPGEGGYSIGTSASENTQTTKELAQGKPLGIDTLYEHLRRWR